MGSEFVPQTDQAFTQLSLRMPVGASLERSDDKVRQVEEIVRGFTEVKTVSTQVGGQGQGFAVGRNQATLNIALTERHERKRSQKEVEDAIRKAIAKVPGIEASLGFDRPIYVAILGNDPVELARIATDFTEQVKKIPGIADIDLSVKPGIPAYAVRLKPGAVRELGLTAPQLASSLRAYVNGEIATYWTTPDGEQIEVLVRLPTTQRERVDQMRALPVAFSKDGAADAAGSGGRHRAGVQPRRDPAPEPAAPRGDLCRRARPPGGRRGQGRAEAHREHTCCRRATASTSAARPRSSKTPSRPCWPRCCWR